MSSLSEIGPTKKQKVILAFLNGSRLVAMYLLTNTENQNKFYRLWNLE